MKDVVSETKSSQMSTLNERASVVQRRYLDEMAKLIPREYPGIALSQKFKIFCQQKRTRGAGHVRTLPDGKW